MVDSGEPLHSGADPQYWELLSDDDKSAYNQLKRDFAMGSVRRGSRPNTSDTFDGMLEAIRLFAERDDGNNWRRFLVCGLCWMDNAIAINTRQLRLLISRCKSSINGSFQKLGYTASTSHSDSWKILFPHIPLLKDHFNDLRQWTIRYRTPAPAALAPVAEDETPPQVEPPAVREKIPAFPLKFRGRLARTAAVSCADSFQ
jgi:hypothetical protein